MTATYSSKINPFTGKLQLVTDASGGTPAGSNQQIQFNDSAAFGASANLIFDKTNTIFKLTGANTSSPNIYSPRFAINDGLTGTEFSISLLGGSELDMYVKDDLGNISAFMAWNINGEWEFNANDWGTSSGGFPTGPSANFVWYPNERARMKLDYLGKLTLMDDCENATPSARLDVRGSFLVNTDEIVSGYTDAQAVISNPTGAGVFRFEGQDYAKFEFKAIHTGGSAANAGAWQLYARNDGGSPTLHLGALNDAENSELPVLDVFRSGDTPTDFHIYPTVTMDSNLSQYCISADTSGIISIGDPYGNGSGYSLTISDPNFAALFSPTMKVGIGMFNFSDISASLHIQAGSTAAGTAPIKYISGALMTSPEVGAEEFLTDLKYLTRTTGATRLVELAAQASRLTAKNAAQASVVTFTPPSDGSFLVAANVLVTTATLHNFTVTCSYTDEGNTSRTVTMPFSVLAGTFVTAITNASGAVPYEGIPIQIRVKGGTAITVATTGTFTTVTYNVEGTIIQIA